MDKSKPLPEQSTRYLLLRKELSQQGYSGNFGIE